jgi:hypothetical protein
VVHLVCLVCLVCVVVPPQVRIITTLTLTNCPKSHRVQALEYYSIAKGCCLPFCVTIYGTLSVCICLYQRQSILPIFMYYICLNKVSIVNQLYDSHYGAVRGCFLKKPSIVERLMPNNLLLHCFVFRYVRQIQSIQLFINGRLCVHNRLIMCTQMYAQQDRTAAVTGSCLIKQHL